VTIGLADCEALVLLGSVEKPKSLFEAVGLRTEKVAAVSAEIVEALEDMRHCLVGGVVGGGND
jgi:hypothetical protein